MAKINITPADNVNAKPMSKGLMLVLLVTVGATAWTAMHDKSANEDADVVLSSRASRRQHIADDKQTSEASLPTSNQVAKVDNALIPWDKLKREPALNKTNDVFKVHSWVVVPPVKKVKPPPPPPPVAPPAPFTYMGKLEDTPNGTLIFLLASNKLYSVVKGQNVNPMWRLDAEDTNSIHLTYLPLGLPQVLSKSAKEVVAANPGNAAEMNP